LLASQYSAEEAEEVGLMSAEALRALLETEGPGAPGTLGEAASESGQGAGDAATSDPAKLSKPPPDAFAAASASDA
jgi:hypothetical protein